MGNIKFEDLDDSPIDFDLSEEDFNSIKGGSNFKLDLENLKDWKELDIIIIKIEAYNPCKEPWADLHNCDIFNLNHIPII
ncbi:MAG: hypothetical protein QNJ47_23595 [Nostocaceae cyanobacterium]|nr:hypothetical protein [Nostocaceae cyanobacterium]